MYRPLRTTAVSATLFLAACTMADGDRCPAGMHYDPDARVCELCDTDQVWDDVNYLCADVGGDADSDADGDGGADGGDGPPTGLGEPCDSDEDCEGYEAALCAINPLTDEGQYCTLENCTPADCPAGWECCDCTDVAALGTIACAADADVSALEFGGCTCS